MVGNKNKQKIDKERNDKKRQQYYEKVKNKYQSGNLTSKDLEKIPHDMKKDYIISNLQKRYPESIIKYDCECCAINLLFGGNTNCGNLSDENLSQLPGVKPKH